MKTIHHTIVAGMDAGMSEEDATQLATSLHSQEKPLESLDAEIKRVDETIHVYTARLNALNEIRKRWVYNSGGRELEDPRLRQTVEAGV